jgi:hypothetical protein
MHVRNAICTAILVALISALSWGLHSLASAIGLFSFVIFCVVAFALMVAAGYALPGRSQQ